MSTIEYQMTKRELIYAGIARTLKRRRIIIMLSLFLSGAIFLINIGGSFRGPGYFFLAYVLFYPLLLWRVFHRQIKANPAFISIIRFGFDEACFVSIAGGIKTERLWHSLKFWSQSKEHFFLEIDSLGTALTIPKRAFTNQQMNIFLDKLKNIPDINQPSKNG